MSRDQKKNYEVRVFCPQCRGGDNVIWKGSLFDWGILMGREAKRTSDIPEWAQYAHRHERAHGHIVMVEYPTRTVPLFSPLKTLQKDEGK